MADEAPKNHPDAPEDAAMLKPIVESLVKAIEMLASKVDELEQGHGHLSKLVVDDLIGGIHSMYKANVRNDRIENLKSKFGDVMNPHIEMLKHLSPEGMDHWGKLADLTENTAPEELENHVHSIAKGLGEKFDAIRGIKKEGEPAKVEGEAVINTPGEEPKVETASTEEPKEEESTGEKRNKKDMAIAEKLSKSKTFKLR